MALVFTFAIVRSTNVKYASLKRTVDAVKVTQFIPAGSEIRGDCITKIKLPETTAEQMNFVKEEDIIGKTTKVSLVEGQLLIQDVVDSTPRNQDMLEIHVPVDLSSSAGVIAGDVVDVFSTEDGQQGVNTVLIYQAAKVIHSYDQSGNEIYPASSTDGIAGPPGSQSPVSVGLEIARDAAEDIINAAANGSIYLAKTNQPG